MQNKLRQLVISALKRNEYTAHLPLRVSVRGYDVVISGQVASDKTAHEVLNTVKRVSPHLRVQSDLHVAVQNSPALSR